MPSAMPSEDALLKAMEVSKSSAEGAAYLNQQMNTIVTKAKMKESSANLLLYIDLFAEQVKMQFGSQSRIWNGAEAETTLFNVMHAQIADSAAQMFASVQDKKEELQEVNLNFAIDEKGNFLRGWG
ncbi:MAG: hypothetical protein CK426_00435 [Legionella sp.]|nr:MAG: hypothetical protein CK423_09140 [Legionella sp.]PJE00137.1 MAG: hypothetical protein CK426_00435 [Legionella sp.]